MFHIFQYLVTTQMLSDVSENKSYIGTNIDLQSHFCTYGQMNLTEVLN
jgi:hypothetical protein